MGSYGTEAVRFVTMLLRQRKQGERGTTANVTTAEPALPQSNLNTSVYGTRSNRRTTRGGTAYVEDDAEEEDPDEDGYNSESDGPMADSDDGLDDWEDNIIAGEDTYEEEDSGDLLDSVDDSGQEYFISLSDTQKEEIDTLQSLLEHSPPAADSEILESFANVILQAFTSQPSDSVANPYHAPVEVYLISRGITKDGGFRSSMGMSNTFSKVQYAALYTIMRQCSKQPNPIE